MIQDHMPDKVLDALNKVDIDQNSAHGSMLVWIDGHNYLVICVLNIEVNPGFVANYICYLSINAILYNGHSTEAPALI